MSERFSVSIFFIFVFIFGLFGYFLVRTNTEFEDVVAFIYPPDDQIAASIAFAETVNKQDLKRRYDFITKSVEEDQKFVPKNNKRQRPIRILIVPGHDSESRGTHFGGKDEVEFNRIVADYLYGYLAKDPAFDVMNAHKDGDYHPNLKKYFEEEKEEIVDFQKEHKERMGDLVEEGKVEVHNGVQHNVATSDVVTRLYGINKWANKTEMDLVIHIHFNDHAGRRSGRYGKHEGFSIYVPEKQFSNAYVSREIAEDIAERLDKFWNISSLEVESEGVIEDQDLIAVGAFNTLEAASVLIEYGYIYENQFHNKEFSEDIFRELAFQTYVGITDFFDNTDVDQKTSLLPHGWESPIDLNASSKDMLSLQSLLAVSGYYPAPGYDDEDCILSGVYNDCTKTGLIDFQKDHDIQPATGVPGPQTRAILNNLVFE